MADVHHAGRLGVGELTATIRPVRSRRPIRLASRMIRWTRSLNQPSGASVTIGAQYRADGTAVRFIGDLDTFAVELVVERDGATVWEGPVTGWSESEGNITINAFDSLVFATYFPAPISDLAGDAAFLAASVLQTVYGAAGDSPVQVDVRPSGVQSVFRVTAPRDAMLLEALSRSLLETQVSITCLGPVVVVRGVDDTRKIARLTERHFSESPFTTGNDGVTRPDQIVVYGAGNLIGVYPPDETLQPRGRYKVAIGFDRDFLKSQDEVDRHALALYAQASLNGGTILQAPSSSSLTPDAPVTVDQLVPGGLVDIELPNQAVGFLDVVTMRLTQVTGQQGAVDGAPRNPQGRFTGGGSGGKEFVQISLEAYAPTTVIPEWTFVPAPPPDIDTTLLPGEAAPPVHVRLPSR